MRPAATFLAAFGPILVVATALAGERDTPSDPDGLAQRRTTEDRAFVYSVDPRGPSLGTVSVESSVGVGSGVAALRPLPSASDARTIQSLSLIHI